MSSGDWSSLPQEILDLISNRLTFDPDYICFRSVCVRWRSSSPKRRSQLPWLLCLRDHNDFNNKSIFSLFKFSSNSSQILVPELLKFPLFHGMRCIGSSQGWMVLTHLGSRSIVLFNPLTRSTTRLPTLPISGDSPRCAHLGIALSPDGVALSFCSYHRKYSFWRPGDDAWTLLPSPDYKGRAAYVCFFRERFYVASYGEVYVVDLGPNPRVQIIASVKVNMFRVPEIYLVESDGALLVVHAFYSEYFRRHSFTIYRLKWGEQVKLAKVESLGGSALFLGHHNCFSVCASQFLGCRGNSIYYIWKRNNTTKLKVCDFKDESDVSVGDDASLYYGYWKSRVWFTPNLLR